MEIKFPHTVWVGQDRILAGATGIVIGQTKSHYHVQISDSTSTKLIYVPQSFVDIIDDEIVWIND